MRQELLTAEQIERALAELSVEWTVVGGSRLRREYTFEDFAQALEFVNRVGSLAEEAQHHPDIALSWGKVSVVLSTHSLGGLTTKDFMLANKIERLS